MGQKVKDGVYRRLTNKDVEEKSESEGRITKGRRIRVVWE